ncbi:hypothetical protein [Vibrio scophthalmi]|uniref:Phage tail collar domain-containing protein n=1 Tax=Vibrio scophthalmi TaxID=45658 RepID=A0A1E3WLA0_9VIBR|nr:hypothetical protein [Vibrio scophthalmi]ODS09762.1 hypothetical protein VSF3289_03224 [Vibrio scophthalmi]
MSALQAIPTPHGIDILNSELKNTVTKYQLVGALTHDAAAEALYTFHTATIETSYYDDNGVLTFILNLPIETHFDEYLHRIDVLDSQNQAVIECPTPKIALAKGIGGMVTLKAAIKGQAGDVVFKHGEFVTETELQEIYIPPLIQIIEDLKNGDNPYPQYIKFAEMVGEWRYSLNEREEDGWLDLKGGTCSRTVDLMLWAWASNNNLVIDQSLKNTEPKKYAAYFGDGNDRDSFTLPNLHLGHFVRGNKTGSEHGAVQGDAIRDIEGVINDSHGNCGMYGSGVFQGEGTSSYRTNLERVNTSHSLVRFKASHVVPTADENRPETLNLTAKICRGWK